MDDGDQRGIASCSICIDTIDCKEWVALIGCGHVFHHLCWEQSKQFKKCCPHCRGNSKSSKDAKVDQYAIRLFNVETKSVSASLGSQRQTPGKHNNTQNGDASNADHTALLRQWQARVDAKDVLLKDMRSELNTAQSNNELAVRVQQDQAEKITQLKAKRTQLKAELLQCEDTVLKRDAEIASLRQDLAKRDIEISKLAKELDWEKKETRHRELSVRKELEQTKAQLNANARSMHLVQMAGHHAHHGHLDAELRAALEMQEGDTGPAQGVALDYLVKAFTQEKQRVLKLQEELQRTTAASQEATAAAVSELTEVKRKSGHHIQQLKKKLEAAQMESFDLRNQIYELQDQLGIAKDDLDPAHTHTRHPHQHTQDEQPGTSQQPSLSPHADMPDVPHRDTASQRNTAAVAGTRDQQDVGLGGTRRTQSATNTSQTGSKGPGVVNDGQLLHAASSRLGRAAGQQQPAPQPQHAAHPDTTRPQHAQHPPPTNAPQQGTGNGAGATGSGPAGSDDDDDIIMIDDDSGGGQGDGSGGRQGAGSGEPLGAGSGGHQGNVEGDEGASRSAWVAEHTAVVGSHRVQPVASTGHVGNGVSKHGGGSGSGRVQQGMQQQQRGLGASGSFGGSGGGMGLGVSALPQRRPFKDTIPAERGSGGSGPHTDTSPRKRASLVTYRAGGLNTSEQTRGGSSFLGRAAPTAPAAPGPLKAISTNAQASWRPAPSGGIKGAAVSVSQAKPKQASITNWFGGKQKEQRT